jgi:hypothetical protein
LDSGDKECDKKRATYCDKLHARVSTQDQTLNLQKDALEKLGCNKIFTDTASGTKTVIF